MQPFTVLVPGKQGRPVRVLQIGKQCPNLDLRQFLHQLVGNTSQTQKSHFM